MTLKIWEICLGGRFGPFCDLWSLSFPDSITSIFLDTDFLKLSEYKGVRVTLLN